MISENLMSVDEMENLLALIEDAHKSTTRDEFRHVLVHGLSSLIESTFCSWTELSAQVMNRPSAQN